MTDTRTLDALIKKRPDLDLAAEHAEAIESGDIAAAQVCRTCIFVTKRTHAVPTVEVLKAKRQGRDIEELMCHPDEVAEVRNIYSDAQIQAVNADGSVPVNLVRKTERVAARTETCGQKLAEKCRNCARLVRQTVSIEGGVNANGRAWYREVLVGGHCSIPEEGIVVEGEVKFCDRKPMPLREQEQNCYTCGNNQTFGSVWMNDHGSLAQVDITAYEMEKARTSAGPEEVGLAIWAARQRKGQVLAPITPNSERRSLSAPGLRKFIPADVLEAHTAEITRVIKPAVTKRTHRGTSCMQHEVKAAWQSAWVTYGQYLYGHSNGWFHLAAMAAFAQGYKGQIVTSPCEWITEVIEPEVTETTTEVTHYTVQFRGSAVVAKLDAHSSDDRVGIVHATNNPTKVVVEITSPWHRQYGVGDNDFITKRRMPWEVCPQCNGESRNPKALWHQLGCTKCNGLGHVTILEGVDRQMPDLRHLVDPWCVERGKADVTSDTALSGFACTEAIPCYFHAKAPRTIEVAEGVERIFGRPEGNISVADLDERRLLIATDGHVTDSSEEAGQPNIAIFRNRRRSLPRNTDAQYFEEEAKLTPGRGRRVNLAWGAFMTEEPWKPYCTLNMANPNEGLNFREVMGDWFGDPRAVQVTNPMHDRVRAGMVIHEGKWTPMTASSSYYSWAKHAELEDWIRVTNPAERYTEEIVRNEHLMRTARKSDDRFDQFGQRKEPFVMPEDTQVTKLAMHGVEGREMTPAEYMDWLAELVEVPIGDDGQTMMVSRKWMLYRYEMVGRTSANKKRRVTNGNADAELVRFNHDTDDGLVETFIGFRCTVPGGHPASKDDPAPGFYTVDEVNDPENPTCEVITYHNVEDDEIHVCGAPLVWDEADREWEQGHMKMSGRPNPDEPYRRVGGPTMAGGPNSRRWLQDERLLRMGCENWRPKPWVRGRRAATPKRRSAEEMAVETKRLIDLTGKTIDVILNGERIQLVVGDDTQVISPLVQAIVENEGSEEIIFTGGRGDRIVAKVLSIS